MKSFFIFVATFCMSLPAFAVSPKTVDFSKIDLDGLKIIDDEGNDTFQYKIKPLNNPPASLVQQLETESVSKIISPMYELNEPSAFKNIYVFVSLDEDGNYELTECLVNKSGSIFVLDLEILDVSPAKLDLQNGPPDSIIKYTATNAKGLLFP